MHTFHNLRDTHLKVTCYKYVSIKIYGENISVYTMCIHCVSYYFSKNNENCMFLQNGNFQSKPKMSKKWVCHYFAENEMRHIRKTLNEY